MKLFSIIVLALTLPALSACVTSGQEEMEARAAAACVAKSTEEERMKCRDTELAAMTALERDEIRDHAEAVSARERREAIGQAYGLPKKVNRQNRSVPLPGEGT